MGKLMALLHGLAPVVILIGVVMVIAGVVLLNEDAKVIGTLLAVGSVAVRLFTFGSHW